MGMLSDLQIPGEPPAKTKQHTVTNLVANLFDHPFISPQLKAMFKIWHGV